MKPIATLFAAAMLVAGAVAVRDCAAAAEGEKKTAKTADSKKKTAKTVAPKLPFKTKKENFGYAVGMNVGRQIVRTFKRQFSFVEIDQKQLAKAIKLNDKTVKSIEDDGIPVDRKRLSEGFSDAITGAKAKLTDLQLSSLLREANSLAQAAQQKRLAKKLAERKKATAKALKDGQAFLAKNKAKKGIVTTKSGLQYEVLKKGTGKKPTAADTVTVHYVGTLRSGKEFDSSRKRGRPAEFRVGRVIRGWTEALQLMQVGARWKLYIPSELAYGPRGSQGGIGPNEVLIFDVELLDVKAAAKSKPKR